MNDLMMVKHGCMHSPAFFLSVPHSHRLWHENKQRKITGEITEGISSGRTENKNYIYQHYLRCTSTILEFVDSFKYLGSVSSKDGSTQKEIKNTRIKAKNAFASLRLVWRLSVYNIRTKFHLYNNIDKPVMLNVSKC